MTVRSFSLNCFVIEMAEPKCVRACAANAGISSAAGENVRRVLTFWRPYGNVGFQKTGGEVKKKINRPTGEKKKVTRKIEEKAGREIFIWLRL